MRINRPFRSYIPDVSVIGKILRLVALLGLSSLFSTAPATKVHGKTGDLYATKALSLKTCQVTFQKRGMIEKGVIRDMVVPGPCHWDNGTEPPEVTPKWVLAENDRKPT